VPAPGIAIIGNRGEQWRGVETHSNVLTREKKQFTGFKQKLPLEHHCFIALQWYQSLIFQFFCFSGKF